MAKRGPKSVEEKLEVVHLYLEQGKSTSILTKAFGVNGDTGFVSIKQRVSKGSRSVIAGRNIVQS